MKIRPVGAKVPQAGWQIDGHGEANNRSLVNKPKNRH